MNPKQIPDPVDPVTKESYDHLSLLIIRKSVLKCNMKATHCGQLL